VTVSAIGPDPNGIERVLGTGAGVFAPEETALDLELDLPIELRNRVTRVALTEARSAGAWRWPTTRCAGARWRSCRGGRAARASS
jgi:hypothetical protein